MKKILFTAICAMISCVLASAQPMTETTVRQGKVRGVLEKGLGYFKAIPFAEAPTGNLRWKAPVPKKAWEGTFDATEYGAMPPQHAVRFPGAPEPKVSEDCLYLNVITPASKPGENLPVLAWIRWRQFRQARHSVREHKLSYRSSWVPFFQRTLERVRKGHLRKLRIDGYDSCPGMDSGEYFFFRR